MDDLSRTSFQTEGRRDSETARRKIQMSYEEMRLDRRTAIRAEIEAAIRLFLSADYVPAHVLAFAAKGQLRGVAKSRGIDTFDDEAELRIKEEYISLWRKAINASYNFFKHADNDPELELEHFRPETTVMALFSAVINYGLVYGQRTLMMTLVFAWSLSRHPNIAKESLRRQINDWKTAFGDPEGKPLDEAVKYLRDMIEQSDRVSSEVLARLMSPDVSKQIEQ